MGVSLSPNSSFLQISLLWMEFSPKTTVGPQSNIRFLEDLLQTPTRTQQPTKDILTNPRLSQRKQRTIHPGAITRQFIMCLRQTEKVAE